MKEQKSVFVEVFGENPLVKILDFLIVNESFDYSLVDIAKYSNVGYSTLKLLWKKLERSKLIIQTRTVGKAKMFRLNIENPLVKEIKNFYWNITKEKIHEEFAKEMEIKI